LTQLPLQIRHFEKLVNISTYKSYNKIYAYIRDIGREKIQTKAVIFKRWCYLGVICKQ